ncbi:MAG: hypothetical protein DRJ60_05740 [Thermoprotei archaeon]|nr:MAG: hypothetical protein DRJ60_05740 [Thermoprotei archaeon]
MSEEKEEKVELKDLAGDFSVLSNPVRLKLLMSVHEKGSCTLKELIDEAQRDESTVKRHVKELIEHGFLAKSNEKKPRYYITDKGVLAITFLRVKAEPTMMQRGADKRDIKLKSRGRGKLSTLLYNIKRITIRRAVFYSFSIGCAIMGLLGLLALSVELFYRILWLLMWLIIAYVFKVLAS